VAKSGTKKKHLNKSDKLLFGSQWLPCVTPFFDFFDNCFDNFISAFMIIFPTYVEIHNFAEKKRTNS